MNFKISAYIIHNNSIKRKFIRTQIKNLIKTLNINLNQVSKQKIPKNNYSNLILKILNLKIILFKELFNIYHKRFLIFNDLISYLANIAYIFKRILKILFSSKIKNLETYKHNVIEKIVRDKHIFAWELFLKTDSDYIIIFEDDAICLENSKKRLHTIFNNLYIENQENIFLDLAGGYKLSKILPLKNNLNNKVYDVYINDLYTNTACCYLLSRNLVSEFLEIVNIDQFSKNFPIDYLLNYLGFKSNKKIFSGHFLSPIFTHGSFKYNVESWQKLS